MKKRLVAILMAAGMVLSLAACGAQGSSDSASSSSSGGESGTPEASGTSEESGGEEADNATPASAGDMITIGITGDPGDISPFVMNSEGRIGVMRSIYETMMDNDTISGGITPVLLKSYEVVDEATYNVEIYDNIVDQAGNPFTASDVKFCYDTKAGITPGQMSAYDSFDVVDDTHLVLHINPESTGFGVFEQLMMEVNMVTQASYEASSDGMTSSPVGTGPYKVTAYSSGSSLELERWDDYWQSDDLRVPYSQANIAKVKYLVIPENSQMSVALETGTIDGSVYINEADFVNFINDDGTAKEGYSTTAKRDNLLYTIYFNGRREATSDVKVRQAICYALDNAAIMQSTYGNNGEAAANLGNANYADFDTSFSADDYYAYDMDKAKELLAEAGYPDGGLELDLALIGLNYYENMAQLIQAYCSAIGITVNLNTYEDALFSSITDDENGDWDIALQTQGSPVPYVNVMLKWYQNVYYTFGNKSLVKDDTVDAAVTHALDLNEAGMEATTEALQAIKDSAYWYNLGSCFKQIITNDTIKNAVVDAKGQLLPGACEYN